MSTKSLVVEIPTKMLDAEAKKKIRKLETAIERKDTKIEVLKREIAEWKEKKIKQEKLISIIQTFSAALKNIEEFDGERYLEQQDDWYR